MCGIFHWLFGNWCTVNVLCYVNLRLYILQFVVCCRFGAAGFEWCSFSRLKHNCSVHVVCGGWGLMTVRNSDIKLVFHSSTITMVHGPIHIRSLFVFSQSLTLSVPA